MQSRSLVHNRCDERRGEALVASWQFVGENQYPRRKADIHAKAGHHDGREFLGPVDLAPRPEAHDYEPAQKAGHCDHQHYGGGHPVDEVCGEHSGQHSSNGGRNKLNRRNQGAEPEDLVSESERVRDPDAKARPAESDARESEYHGSIGFWHDGVWSNAFDPGKGSH
ncbi:hypothetical protein KL950_001375 [Ogataea haglerorum]|nr:hypothetical protein KL950_001375 [Ogataea haglerorum]